MTVDIYRPLAYHHYQYSNGSPMLTCLRDQQALELLRADLHAEFPNDYDQPLYIFQGAFHDGQQSAATHMGSSAYDLHPSNFEAKARLGAKHGIIVYHRLPLPGKWVEHLHVLIRGGKKMNPAAQAQVRDWDLHLDGLASHAKYDTGPAFPWFPVEPFVYHEHGKDDDQGGAPPPQFPDVSEAIGVLGSYHAHGWTVEQDLEVKAHNHPNIQPMQDALAAVKAALPAVRDARTALVHWLNTNQER